MKLVLNDQTEIVLADESTALDCVTVLNSFAEIDDLREKFTEDNVNGATLNGVVLENIVPVGLKAEAAHDGGVTVHFVSRKKTYEEIIDEQLSELREALMEIAFASDEPATTDEEPVSEEPTNEEPVDEVPADDEPTGEDPADDIVEGPQDEEPIADEEPADKEEE